MPKATQPSYAARHFEARLERMRSRLNWVVIHLPFDAAKVWRLRGQIKSQRRNQWLRVPHLAVSHRDGRHFLLVNKRMQRGARAVEGSVARSRWSSTGKSARLPSRRDRAHSHQDRRLHRWYGGLNHSTRADIAKWITEPKGAEARVRRAEQIAERLMNVMRRSGNCRLFCRWRSRGILGPRRLDAMSPSRRRGHLFGIFYYRTPDAQGRRIDKMLEDATVLRRKSATRTTRERD